ncbi:sensor histidine kinase [Granulicella sp. WH15]|uniref:sensor histidine kinase n=1 Tax=Granulicella sp. WH15 TaxID=2602070 RepID=UPI001366E8BE|nr:sensor histidine kinase [Granulicella sp. WH15]QHN04738.1 sensor histidine kinase [Granulicella sp. WH15]
MADAQEVDLSYGSFMVLRKPLFFWLRWGGFVLALTDVVSGMQTLPGTYRSLNLLFWSKIAFALVYGFLFVRNIPLRINLAPHRERSLLLQILLGVALSLDLTNLSVFCIPFCVPVNRRYRWGAIAVAFTFAAQLIRIFIYRNVALPQLAQIAHSPFKIVVALFDMTGNYIWFGFSFLGACLLFELAKRQHQLVIANHKLVDLQAQIKESARIEERLRLSRELHDAAGHYLTSLSIQLEIAQHRAAEAVLPPIARAQLITRVLLAEIRESVSAWREDETRELSSALKELLRDVTGVQTHLDIQGDIAGVPVSVSHSLYRCAQEAVTNVLRHSEAKNLWIQLARQDGAIVLTIKDDGGGCGEVTKGNGLRGMQSRVEEMRGTLHVGSLSDGGFAVAIGVPIEEEQTA